MRIMDGTKKGPSRIQDDPEYAKVMGHYRWTEQEMTGHLHKTVSQSVTWGEALKVYSRLTDLGVKATPEKIIDNHATTGITEKRHLSVYFTVPGRKYRFVDDDFDELALKDLKRYIMAHQEDLDLQDCSLPD
jgi:lipid II:glycine glycyltransferase (peptidoglycan interpeptide bridge formation enzyme)